MIVAGGQVCYIAGKAPAGPAEGKHREEKKI